MSQAIEMRALTWLWLFLLSLNLLLASLAFTHSISASHELVGCCHILLLLQHFFSWALGLYVVRLAFIMNHDRLFQIEGVVEWRGEREGPGDHQRQSCFIGDIP